ncbi:calcium-binding protein [Psychromonas sp. PT13]|uniref:calcium-binding protein n=1 Tax=Psychromonas sp. PT13 TaxID=3439547 RepID=UPI003EB993DB
MGVHTSVEVSYEIEALPDIIAFGTVSDLHNAMAENETLQTLIEQYVAETDADTRHEMIETIIYEWAGVSDVDPYSRDPSQIYGHVMDARQLETLEALVGQGYEGTWCWGEKDPNPHGKAAPLLIAEFEEFAAYVEAQLLAQTEYKEYFTWISSDYSTDGSGMVVDFEQFETMILTFTKNDQLSEFETIEKIKNIVDIAEDLGTYSSTYRESLQESFVSLVAQSPSLESILTSSWITGTDLAETLQGSNENDVIDGGAGDDLLYGKNGDDIYKFSQGHGSDRILDSNGTDTIYLGDGYTTDNIRLSRNVTSVFIERLDENGLATGDSIQVDNFYNFDGTLDSPIESILFESDIRWDTDQIQSKFPVDIDAQDNNIFGSQDVDQINALEGDDVVWGYGGNDQLSGDAGNDELNGGDGDDTLIGGTGNDDLTGANGADLYLFSVGHGKDTIYNYDGDASSIDNIQFDETITSADIELLREGDDLLINGLADDQIYVKSFFSESGTSPYAIDNICFSDGTIWDKAFILDAVNVITESDDLVIGYDARDENFDGLGGDDIIYGMGGNDTLLGNVGADKLYGGVGNDELYGGDGDDSLNAGAGNDVLNGGAGVDTLDGSTGNDTLYGEDGDDVLQGGTGNDVLEGGAGNDSLAVAYSGNNTLDGGAGNDTLTVATPTSAGSWSSYYNQANSATNTLTGGLGDDLLIGGLGTETYIFNRGDGNDIIRDKDIHGASTDRLELGEGILREQVSVARMGEDIVLTIVDPTGVASDSITIESAFGNSQYRIEEVVFADGTILTSQDLLDLSKTIYGTADDDVMAGTAGDDILIAEAGNDTLNGEAGNDELHGGDGDDYLNGGDGADILIGGAGNDKLIGGQGNDAYQFSRGDAQETINNFSNIADETDQLILSEGIDKEDIWLTRNDDDLVIDFSGSDDQITVDDWFVDEAYQIDEIYAGADMLSSNNVDALISAMAGFDNPAAGNLELSQQVKDEIAVSIVATWQAA